MTTAETTDANRTYDLPLKSCNTTSNSAAADRKPAFASSPDTAVLLSLADSLLGQGRLEQARAAYRKILESDHNHIKAILALSRIARRLGILGTPATVCEPQPSSSRTISRY